jgi:ankyrin repeat protein
MGAAAGSTNIEVLETLVKAGANPTEKDENGTTALSQIGDGGLPYFKFFIEHGSDVNEQGIRANGKYKGTKMISPLHFAASMGNKELVLYLLSKGAKTDSTFSPKNL